MRIQDYFVDTTARAAADFFKYAKAVPADKLEWAPEGGRSTLDLCRELAMTPTWTVDTINGKEFDWNEEAAAELKRTQEAWKTVEDCEAEYARRAVAMNEMIQNMPDERLSEKRWLPYSGGRDFSMIEMLEYPSWNADYHTGQIAYIQTLYGDKQMY